MTEWRLFPEGTVPEYSTVEFFDGHRWVPPHGQVGHAERIQMTAETIEFYCEGAATLSDLGCGDGSLLAKIRHLPLRMWGYDAGRANVQVARRNGLSVEQADFLTDPIELGDIVVVSEVLEHLADPHRWLGEVRADRIVATSPSSETGDWHYVHHAWAWDEPGYRELFEDAGWSVLSQHVVSGGNNRHCGRWGEQWFQVVYAEREQD